MQERDFLPTSPPRALEMEGWRRSPRPVVFRGGARVGEVLGTESRPPHISPLEELLELEQPRSLLVLRWTSSLPSPPLPSPLAPPRPRSPALNSLFLIFHLRLDVSPLSRLTFSVKKTKCDLMRLMPFVAIVSPINTQMLRLILEVSVRSKRRRRKTKFATLTPTGSIR